MQALQIDPPIPFVVPNVPEFAITLVGCGGTGSHLAQTLARLAAHCRDTNGPYIQLAFVDGDRVEDKNVGRQLFSTADVGKNKAQVLAARFSAVFGISILAFPYMLSGQRINSSGAYGILVGAVDGAQGRRAISEVLNNFGFRLWLDCGNHESSGQVVAGTVAHRGNLQGMIENGLCTRLPAAPLIYPELVKDAPVRPREDCAAAALDNAQSLMVNQTMAAIGGQYLYDVVIRRRLTRFRTVVDLDTLTMRSDAITAANLAEAAGLSVDQILGIKTSKKRRAA